jgi:outer membrane immunogenic protein
MRRSAIAGLIAFLPFTVAAQAADMPLKAPPAPPPLYNWSGPYAGIAGGAAFGHSAQTDAGILLGDGSYNVDGGVLGGTLGFNLQRGMWVFGVEGDLSWADVSGSSDQCGAPFLTHNCGSKLKSLATLRGRLGAAFGAHGTWLAYVTGGLAGGRLEAWDDFFPASGSQTRWGWTLGGGLETALARDWTAKLEYLYVDLGNKAMFDIIPGTPESVSFTASVVRLGINYRFMTY